MKKLLLIIALLISTGGFCIDYSTLQTGNFQTASTWAFGGRTPPTPSVGNSAYVSVNSGHTVTLNSNIIFGNNCNLDVYGTLIINGDLIADNNSLTINVPCELIVNGKMEGKNGATIAISGNVSVSGDVVFNNGGSITLDSGNVNIGGNFIGDQNSEIYGTGTIDVGGNNSFDSDPPETIDIKPYSGLPVELLFLINNF